MTKSTARRNRRAKEVKAWSIAMNEIRVRTQDRETCRIKAADPVLILVWTGRGYAEITIHDGEIGVWKSTEGITITEGV